MRARYSVLGFDGSDTMNQTYHAAYQLDDAASEAFYRDHVVLDDREEVERQLHAGVCVRVHCIARALTSDTLQSHVDNAAVGPPVHIETS